MFGHLRNLVAGLAVGFCWIMPAVAQTVMPDSNTGESRTVVSGTTDFTVTGGTQRLNTLFHSFEDFSPGAADVLFQLDSSQGDIEQVVTRVVGGEASVIDGKLALSGGNSPSLFLINPSGIRFGKNARLSLPGAFIASTADAVTFSEDLVFSAIAPQAPPLLTVSTPVGLQFGASVPRAITAQGDGHAVSSTNPIFLPYTRATASGLSVGEGETLALIGGSINLQGGNITASGGHIELSGVTEGSVILDLQREEVAASYEQVEQFGDITLSQQSLVDTSGSLAGASQMRGRNITLSDGSMVWNQNRGSSAAKPISINATEHLLIDGASPTVSALSGIVAETLLLGAASDIDITTPQLTVQNGATIFSRSFSPGRSGDIIVDAEQATITGYVSIAPDVFTVVGTTSSGSSDAGNVTASLQSLSVRDGGYFGSTTLGSGRGGDVTIYAETVDVVGASATNIPSVIIANTAGRGGNSGDVNISTRNLLVQNGGLLTTTSVGIGDAGNVDIRASEQIEISRTMPSSNDSTIASTVDFPPLSYQLLLNLSGAPRGSAGSVTLTTPVLKVLGQGSSVAVLNQGQGDAGQIQISAGSVVLNQGDINAVTANGGGGNINLQLQDVLVAHNGSLIETSAQGGSGDGGNIKIAAPVIVGSENSDIIANAFQGEGGDIKISTQGLFGYTFREQLTSDSDITASSQFGVDGTVGINSFGVAPSIGLTVLPEETTDASEQIIEGCSATGDNRFVATGRGGIPISPTQTVADNRPWSDMRDLSAIWQDDLSAVADSPMASNIVTDAPTDIATDLTSKTFSKVIEANGWRTSPSGQIELMAADSAPFGLTAYGTCAG